MAETPSTKLITPLSAAVDLLLCAAFFTLIYSLVSSHVPSANPKMVLFWGAAASGCMTLVFWLCIQMFRMVLRHQRELRAESK
jgi:hypothetical protein